MPPRPLKCPFDTHTLTHLYKQAGDLKNMPGVIIREHGIYVGRDTCKRWLVDAGVSLKRGWKGHKRCCD